jgi:phospholipid/cholesterol/gamma-HCH transport system substrate-binding protein
METRASFVLIGSFTLAVIAAAFGFVLWFQSLHTTKARSPIRVIFEGPASGLRNGGSVNFNGIRIGEVISVKLDNPRRVIALAMVENTAPIRKDTLVGLEFQGLTGVAAISLKGGEEAAPPVPLDEDGIPLLTADPNALQDVTEAIRGTLQNINRVVADNQQAVKNSLRNLETFTSSLARNSEKIDDIMAKVDGVMVKADSLMLGLNSLAGGREGGELFQTVKSIRELAEDFDKRSGALMADGRRTLADISRAVINLDRNPTRLLFGAGNSAAPAEASRPAPAPTPAAAAAPVAPRPAAAAARATAATGTTRRQ